MYWNKTKNGLVAKLSATMWLFNAWCICVFLGATINGKVKGEDTVCADDLFRCKKEISPRKPCISKAWVCDGERDCPDGSDEEQNCPAPTCPPQKFQCKDMKMCIPKGWLCDDEPDCLDHSDEGPECDVTEFKCPPTHYHCDGSKKCIELMQLCNGIRDCPDGSDEGMHCRSGACSTKTCPPNSIACKSSYDKGGLCICPKGYYHQGDNCTDVDECQLDSFCDQQCQNSEGSYTCSCTEGYCLQSDNHTCLTCPLKSDGSLPVLLFVTKEKIMLYDIERNGSLHQLNNGIAVPKIKALDYNFEQHTVCYLQYGATSTIAVEDRRTKVQMECANLHKPEAKKKKVPTATLR